MGILLPLLRRQTALGLAAFLLVAAKAWAQPTGCTSTYTATGTAAGGSAGLYGEYYAGQFHKVAGFSEANPVTFYSNYTGATPVRRVDPTVDYAGAGWTGITPPATAGSPPTQFSARYRGSIFLKSGAAYTFYLTSDDASYLFLGKEATLSQPTPNNALIKNGGDHGDITVTRTVTAPSTGLYDVQIIYAQGGGGATARFEYSGGPDNLARAVVPSSALCAGPSGQTYATNQAPIATNTSNVTVNSNGSAATLNPNLAGAAYDLDGTVTGFTITSLPASGTLNYNGTPITAGALPYSVSAANLGNLSYLAPTGSSTSVSFTFTATDNSGATSGTATYSIPVASGAADLGTVLTAPVTAPQGSLIYYNANVTNNGPAAVTGVNTTINLPTGLSGVSLSNSGSYNPSTGVATFPAYNLAVGQTLVRNIAFSMPGFQFNATATSTAPGFADQNSLNNTGTASTGPTQVADVSVAINGPARVITNQAVIYGIVPTNLGPSTATNVVLQMQLAANLAGVVVSNGGSYNATTGAVSWPPIASLPNGGTLVYTARFNAPSLTGSINGTASGTSSTADGDPVAANNNGTADQAKITTQVVTQSATLLCAQPGKDGAANLNAPFNTYYPGTGTVAAGATSLTVGPRLTAGASTGLTAGDLVVVMQVQGANINATQSDAYGDGIAGDNVASGQLLLDGNFTAGTYEYAVVQSAAVSGGNTTITFTSQLGFGYVSAAATASAGQRRYQVIRVPQYTDVTLTGNVAAPRWNGLTGGALVIDVNGTLNFNGFKLDAAGRGFRGGAGQQYFGAGGVNLTDVRHSNTLTTSANKGEGIVGTPRYVNDADNFAAYAAGGAGAPTSPVLDTQVSGLLPAGVSDGYPNGDRARGGPGNAGGGGTDGNPGANDQNTGGGGGANAARGGVGGNGWDSNSMNGGYGGADFTVATASRLVMGGGGGGGTTNNGTVADVATYPANAGVPTNGFSSSGAAGGGIVLVRASNVNTSTTGTIDVSGADMNYVPQNDASGGGGAGGSVVFLCNASANTANSTVLQNVTILAKGGKGGSNTGGGAPHGPGGGGSGGVIFTSSAINSNSNADPGANGLTFGFAVYGSGVGAAASGQNLNSVTRADVPNIILGCPADVVTTLSTSSVAAMQVASATPSSSVTIYATTTNTGDGNGGGATATNVVVRVQLSPNLASVQLNGQSGGIVTNGVSTYPSGATYNPTTGVATFPAVATMNVGATVSNTITFTMPAQNLLAVSSSTANNDLDPRLANNDGTLPAANIKITAINGISGVVFDDVNYGGGSGRNYATANTSAVASGLDPAGIGSPGTTVELYSSSGSFLQTTTTGPDGSYGFSEIPINAAYTVRVVNSTVKSARNRTATGLVPVQTFRTNSGVADPNRVGGEQPGTADSPANAGSSLLTLQALNPSGGDNTAFVDQVEVLNSSNAVVTTALVNSSFETPALGSGVFQYGPSGGTWSFSGGSGIANNGSAFGQPTAPDGAQVAFLQATSSATQLMNLAPGTYTLRLRAAQRNCCSGTNNQSVSIRVNGVQVGTAQPASNGTYTTYTTSAFTITSAGGSLGSIVAQSISTVNLGGSTASSVDFGFNFSTVVNTNDVGQGSLRQFILNSNALGNAKLDQAASSNGGPDPAAGVETSIFMIPNGTARPGLLASVPSQLNGSGVAVITPNTAANGALPTITDAFTVIDGTTQTLNVGDTNAGTLGTAGTVGTGSSALSAVNRPEVQLVGTPGSANSDYGLNIQADNTTVRGLAIYGFGNTQGNANGADIYVNGPADIGTTITSNVLGGTATSFADLGAAARSTGNGILLANFPVGSTVSASITNNLIGYHGGAGIEDLANSTPTSVNIQNNEIRSNALVNTSAAGVRLGNYGGTVQGNLIADNRGNGVDFDASIGYGSVTGNTLDGNGKGGARTAGVRLLGTANTVNNNVISSNYGAGVQGRPTVVNNTISQNSIYSNGAVTGTGGTAATGQIGIDLQLPAGGSFTPNENLGDAPFVTVNDLNDADGGANSLLNFPIMARASVTGGNLQLSGWARPGAKIEVFAVGGTADPSGFGQGRIYLGTVTEGAAAGGGNLAADTDNGTGPQYSGLINGKNQGTDNTNRFFFSIPVSSLSNPGAAVAGVVLTATATLPNVGTSEFSGTVTAGNQPLPVELTEFTARAVKNTDAQLNWATASEKSNAYFEVQRSTNGGRDFVALGQVAGQGSKATPTSYAFLDKGVGVQFGGQVYYRLKQVDLDGAANYSPVRAVAFAQLDATPALALTPNPTRSTVDLTLTGLPAAASYTATLLDATGRTVRVLTLSAGQARNLDVSELPTGTYLVRVTGTGADGQPHQLTQRLLKQ